VPKFSDGLIPLTNLKFIGKNIKVFVHTTVFLLCKPYLLNNQEFTLKKQWFKRRGGRGADPLAS